MRKKPNEYVVICRDCLDEIGPYNDWEDAIKSALKIGFCMCCGVDWESAIDFEVTK